jgi:hypothetical protein
MVATAADVRVLVRGMSTAVAVGARCSKARANWVCISSIVSSKN